MSNIHFTLSSLSFNFLFVGGVVRDYVLQNSSSITRKSSSVFQVDYNNFKTFLKNRDDIDLSTNTDSKEIYKILKFTFPSLEIKRNFVTNFFTIYNKKIEITSTRIDKECDGRRAKMKTGISYFQDSFRRDFTFNALYLNQDGLIFDFHHGVDDLLQGRICFIGDAETRIFEDYTRIKRYFNFSKRFNMKNEEIEKTIDYIINNSAKPIIMR